MSERKFKVGDKVRIHGDKSDYTEELDGLIGTIIRAYNKDCVVMVADFDNPFGGWMIWNRNMELVD